MSGRAAERAKGGLLYVVATPIGNLGDITVRAIEILRTVPLIAAEDTRLTRRLLDRYKIETRQVSYHARSGPGRLAELLSHLGAGDDLAVVTDAGTPSISDPGAELVAAWAADGGTVVPIPGASAVLAAVVSSGVAGPRWSFEGFLPRTGRDRRERLERIASDERATVVYEAPTRIAATLRDLAAACGPDRPAAVCRELTKLHEEIRRGSLGEIATAAGSGELTLRGEFVIVVGEGSGATSQPAVLASAEEAVAAALIEVEALVVAGTPRGEAARRIAAATGIARRRLYEPPAGR